MRPYHTNFPNVYEALAEVTKIIRDGGFAYVLKSDKYGAIVSSYH